MLVPIRTDSPLRSTPYMNWSLIALNVLVFALQAMSPEKSQRFLLNPRSPELIQYFSYQFMHGSFMHLAGNMLFLYIFGNNVNDKMGGLGYLAFYLAGGVAAGLGHVMTSPNAPVLGASGAVAAVTGAYLALFPRSNITLVYFFIFIGQFELASMYFILFFFLAQDVVMYVYDLERGGGSHVAHAAHIAGTLFGFGVCLSLLAIKLLPRDQFDVVALIQRWNKRRQYRDMVAKGYDPFGYAPKDARPEPPDAATQRAMDLRAEISEAVAHHKLDRAAALFLELKRLDPQQVLSRGVQLDVGNQLAHEGRYADAADAYEQLLRFYPNAEQVEQVELMLGLIYARYLGRYTRAKEVLQKALTRLHGEREVGLARAELERITPLAVGPGPKLD